MNFKLQGICVSANRPIVDISIFSLVSQINKVDKIFNQVFNAAYTRAKQQGEGK